MKRIIPALPACAFTAAICLGMLTGCKGTSDYDTYVDMLKAQPAVIDTISSPASYGAYLMQLASDANDFAAKDVKLNETQQAELSELGQMIEEALTAKYNKLAQTPMILPDSIPVPE